MTDLEKLKNTFNELGVEYKSVELSKPSELFICLSPSINGKQTQSNQEILFEFNSEGGFVEMGAWEKW